MRRAKIEVYQDKSGDYRWRMIASNGRIMADSSEGYTRQTNCIKAMVKVAKNFHNGETKVEL